jgi:hypothetical protein
MTPADRRDDGIEHPFHYFVWYRRHCRDIDDGEASRMQTRAPREGRLQHMLARRTQPSEAAHLHRQVRLRRRGTYLTSPQARPFKSGVRVARIADKRLTLGTQERNEPILRKRQKRPQNSAIGKLSDCRHPGKAVWSALRPATDQMGFELIIAMVRGEQMETAVVTAPVREQPIAGDAGSLLYAGFRLLAGPDEHFVADVSRRQPISQPPDLSATLGTQAMIDGQRTNLALSLARPTIRKDSQRQTVGTAGNRDGDKGRGLETAESGERAVDFFKGQRFFAGLRQQPSCFFSFVA